jgi:phosphoesterase RecJ-like protein
LYNKNPKVIALWGELLTHVSYSPSGCAAWCSISQEQLNKLGVTLTSTIGFENFLAQLSDIDVTIFFCETKDGKSKASLRSKRTDVNALANKFGGGGHKNAAGLRSDLPLPQLIQEISAYL